MLHRPIVLRLFQTSLLQDADGAKTLWVVDTSYVLWKFTMLYPEARDICDIASVLFVSHHRVFLSFRERYGSPWAVLDGPAFNPPSAGLEKEIPSQTLSPGQARSAVFSLDCPVANPSHNPTPNHTPDLTGIS